MIRVLVVDDQELVRAGIRMILATEPDLEIVGEADDGSTAVTACAELRPDVVLMDIRMSGTNGIEATRQILGAVNEPDPDSGSRPGPPKVLILTTFDVDSYVYDALRAGASGFLLKDAPSDQLVAAIRTVNEGVSPLAPQVTRRLVESFAPQRQRPHDPRIGDLTPRELEVLLALTRGLSNHDIAREMVLSDATVKTHVNRVLRKLDLTSRTQAVVFGYESGLVEVGGQERPEQS
jgi:DNA-binding NarL/FixJ family response regulator